MIDDPFAVELAPVRAHRQFQALLRRTNPEFVRCSYLTVCAREPTALELSRSLERLSAGASRAAFLQELLAAYAPRHGSDRWLREALHHEPVGRRQRWSFMARSAMDSLRLLWAKVSRERQSVDPGEAIDVLDRIPPRAGAVAGVAERVHRELSAAIAQRNL
jgi:hypothetical protein